MGNNILNIITENDFQEWLRQLARHYHWLYYHPWKSYNSPQGFPDTVLAKPPRLIFAELKSEDGQPTESQWIWLYTLQHIPNVECYLWRPSDRDEIENILK